MGVVGAAVGSVLANVGATVALVGGLVIGRPLGGWTPPVAVSPLRSYVDVETTRQIAEIGTPVVGRNLVWTVAEFPLLAIVALFGPSVVAAYVITRRIWGLMNIPGWGFGLASSSLVGQELGTGDEMTAEVYGREVITLAVATYAVAAGVVCLLAEPIVFAFVGSTADPVSSVAVPLVYAACVAIVAQGISRGAAGPLDASGDTRWPFYSQAIGMFGFSIPLAYLGATTSLGLGGLYLSFLAETAVPAAINYRRFAGGKWKAISRGYRPNSVDADD